MKNKEYDERYIITLREFLNDFLDIKKLTNIDDKKMNQLAKFSHLQIKDLNLPNVQCIPFEMLTEELLMRGDVLLVADGKSNGKKKNLAPYIRPELLNEYGKIDIDEFIRSR